MTSLIPSLGGPVFTIVAFVVALLVIVAVHEYGHYIVGRWSGIHADVFSVGMGKVLWSRVDKRGTKWQLAAIPAGGYVKFRGDANAASVGGEDEVAGHDPRSTMLGAPLWARALTVLAGPVANFILAVLIFAGYLMYEGKPSEELVLESAYEVPAAFQSELLPGDRIMAVGDVVFGEEGADIDTLPDTLLQDYTIIRDGAEMVVKGPHPIISRVDSLVPRSAADDAKLRVGDFITAIDGEPINAFRDIVAAVGAAEGTPLTLQIWRAGETFDVELAARYQDEPQADGSYAQFWRIGIGGTFFFDPATDPIGVWEATKLGVDRLWFSITTSLTGLWQIITGGISTCNLSGPVGIAQASGSMAAQGAQSYVLFLGMLSAAVGLLNLFPIPILDGGHLVFHAYEAVTRRKPSDRALQFLMVGGLAIIAALMIFALLNDLVLCP